MASANSLDWIREHLRHVGDEVLEVGSRRYKDHAFLDLKGFFTAARPSVRVTGCDLLPGDNVDVVVDLTGTPRQVTRALGGRRFDTVLCVSVLEHIPNVFAAAARIESLLRPGGTLFVSVPFVFRYHGYPGDFWRFTPEAVVHLFPQVDFRGLSHSCVSSLEEGDWMSLRGLNVQKLNRFLFRPREREEKQARKQAKAAGEAVPAYSLAPAMVNLLGWRT